MIKITSVTMSKEDRAILERIKRLGCGSLYCFECPIYKSDYFTCHGMQYAKELVEALLKLKDGE